MKVNEEGREREPKLLDFRVPEFNVVQESCCSISLSPNSISIPHKAREVKSWTVLRSSVNTGLGHDYNSLPRLSMSKSPRLIDNLGCKARGLMINSWFSSFHFLKLCRDCHSYISVKAITIGKKKKRNLIPLNLNQKTPSRDRDLIIYEKFSVLWQIMYCLRRKSISSRFLLNVYGKLFSVVFSFLVFVAACFFPSIGIADKKKQMTRPGITVPMTRTNVDIFTEPSLLHRKEERRGEVILSSRNSHISRAESSFVDSWTFVPFTCKMPWDQTWFTKWLWAERWLKGGITLDGGLDVWWKKKKKAR